MKNLKKALALATAATLVFGNAITVLATEPVEGQVAEGSINGEGESEGHVEKKKTYVTLPTTPAVSPFAYTMDPEGLIAVTGASKYGDTVAYPEAADDTRVYFNNGEIKEGANQGKTGFSGTSNELKVINNSSHDISLTITAEAVSADTDIPLVAKDEIDTAEAASLYLGLIVDTEEAVAIKKAEAATKTLTVAGSPDNFKIAVKSDKSGYEYRTLTLEEYKDLDAANASATELPWAAKAFKLEGAATAGKSITSDTTAPQVKVTWSWVDPSANAAPRVTTTNFAILERDKNATINVDLGLGDLAATGVSAVMWNNTNLLGQTFSYENGVLTVNTTSVNYALDNPTNANYQVIFNDDAATAVSITLTAKE